MSRQRKVPLVTQPTVAAKKTVSIDPTQAGLSVPQCAVYAGLSHWQVRMAIWQGKLPARRVGKSLLILRSDADTFLENLPTVSANNSPWLANRQKEGAA
jgi:excisionase family DNA binding protein